MNPLFYPVWLYGERLAWPKRRKSILQALLPFLAGERTVLDVGCGDGKIAEDLRSQCPGIRIHGVDTHFAPGLRPPIPCSRFDGIHLPFADKTYDACLVLDVLHHSRSPEQLLVETARVARGAVIVKDHDYRSGLDRLLMKWGDYLGNRMFGVDLPYNFRTWEEFERMFLETGFSIQKVEDSVKPGGALELHHHFVVRLGPPSSS
jgi:2-polyprenyl-3-methyl-5-hydroxy-6-metoxy-1,4-benzoquinol methylase